MATDNLRAFLDPIGFAKAYAAKHAVNPRTVITAVPPPPPSVIAPSFGGPPPPPPPPGGLYNTISNFLIGVNSTVKAADKPSTTTINTKPKKPDGTPQIDFTDAVAERAKKLKIREARLEEIKKRDNISLSDAVDVLRNEDKESQTTKPQMIASITTAILTEEDIQKKELKKQRNEIRLQRINQKKNEIAKNPLDEKTINARYAKEDREAAFKDKISAHIAQILA